jgi:hypothetical protein
MPDWYSLVEQRLSRLHLSVEARDEICTELSHHLEDRYQQFLASGTGEHEAFRKTLESVSNWKDMERDIQREREGMMSTFGKQFLLPSGVALAFASLALAVEIRVGPRPAVWNFDVGLIVIFRFWLLALLLTGALSAYLSMRAGANRGRRLLVAVTPALYMLGAMCIAVAAVIASHILKWIPAQPIHPMAILIGLGNWVVLPAMALLLGAVSFCGNSIEPKRTMS